MTKRDYIRQKALVMGQALDDLLPTYDCEGGQNPIAPCLELPSEAEVVRGLLLLDSVFFPCYRENCPGLTYSSAVGYPVETMVTERLDEAYDVLYRQVTRAVPFRWKSEYARQRGIAENGIDVEAEAETIVGKLFGQLTCIRQLLKRDVIAAYNGDPAAQSYAEIILSYPVIRAITTHRVAHELYRLDVPIIPRLMSEWVHSRTGIDIHPGATIGESFFIDHGTGVVIGESAEIGDRVKIYQSATLGARSFPLDEYGFAVKGVKRHPTIEDDVVIYSGATILGDIVIGARSTINANAWVTRSVPPDSTISQRTTASPPAPSRDAVPVAVGEGGR
jgi:serine O-acetyltransferase